MPLQGVERTSFLWQDTGCKVCSGSAKWAVSEPERLLEKTIVAFNIVSIHSYGEAVSQRARNEMILTATRCL
jgi:hypothetical protein